MTKIVISITPCVSGRVVIGEKTLRGFVIQSRKKIPESCLRKIL